LEIPAVAAWNTIFRKCKPKMENEPFYGQNRPKFARKKPSEAPKRPKIAIWGPKSAKNREKSAIFGHFPPKITHPAAAKNLFTRRRRTSRRRQAAFHAPQGQITRRRRNSRRQSRRQFTFSSFLFREISLRSVK